jgi:hypothetical protein
LHQKQHSQQRGAHQKRPGNPRRPKPSLISAGVLIAFAPNFVHLRSIASLERRWAFSGSRRDRRQVTPPVRPDCRRSAERIKKIESQMDFFSASVDKEGFVSNVIFES